MSDVVPYKVTDGVAWLTINRPEARNALNEQVRDGLWDGVRRFNADDCAKVLVPDGELRSAAQELGLRIAGNAPLPVLAGKKTVRLIASHSLEKAYDEAERLWAPVYESDDAQEGPAAFRDKRKPEWKGR